jgi:Zn-dependent protease/CBS domain-containing protein
MHWNDGKEHVMNPVTLFHVRGIPVRIHPSWLAIYGLIAWTLAVGYFPRVLPEMPVVTHWVSALVAALLLFVSVFLHELSHSLVALRYGIPVSSITLHVFGGVSLMEREPHRPGAEMAIAVVGPLTSFAIGAACIALGPFVATESIAAAIVRYLAFVNVAVGVFNLVPGFPLDGGRVLRALVWKAHGDLATATRVASRVGTGFALVLIALGVWQALAGEFLGGLWFVAIGLFLRQAATVSYQQVVLRTALGPRRVGDVMARRVVSVPPGLSIATLVDEYFWRHHVTSFPVVDGGRLLGIVSLRDLGSAAREAWPATTVREVMRPASADVTAAPRDSLWEAFQKVSRNGLGRLAVVDDGQLAGYLSVKDVMHVLTIAGAGPEQAADARAA